MLKLPNSFCRYLRVTCDSISTRSHVRRYSHLNCVGKTCQVEDSLDTLLLPQPSPAEQLRLFASFKKRSRIKIPSLNSNEPKKTKQMSESLQPNLNHISYGGQFEVSSTEDDIDWRSQCGGSGSTTNVKAGKVPPNFRVWEPVVKKTDSGEGNNVFRFRVVSYNVLAQYLLECHPYLYTDCSPRNLKWNVRAARLYDEITNLAPDILCLQEVQASHLDSFYSKFEDMGYFGIFKQKTGHRQDGCAIYFKTSVFELEDHISVEFYQPELPILNRDNIGIMVKLVPRAQPRSPIVVATTHLLYNPKRTDVRLAQIQVLLAEIDRFAYYTTARESGHLPIILTGDLNSTPDSAVIKLLDRGHVSASPFRDSSDWKRIGVTDNCQHLSVYLDRLEGRNSLYSTIKPNDVHCWTEASHKDFHKQRYCSARLKIYNSDYCADLSQCSTPDPPGMEYSELFNSGDIGHSLRLMSTYDKIKPDGSTEASTLQDYWVTVDYIYFSLCSRLKLVDRLRLPTAAECAALGCLPNDVFGSDHLALAAAFELRPYKSSL
ncbi:protein angel homolog 1 isoform X1 [Ostrinia nubilalis]|uniref:protein angel homolog 1 isoform X1 n=1 Tax=Ostrinia nubilalis TaxID=29057 RepID=UPI003082352F